MTENSRALIFMGLMWAVNATQAAPLPPEKPSEFSAKIRKSAAPETLPAALPKPPFDIGVCLTGLGAKGMHARLANAPPPNKDACVVTMPIQLEHMTSRYGEGAVIRFTNEPLIDCRLAEALAHWLGEVVAPVFWANFSSPLKAVRTGPGYECRNRNNEAAGKLSAHANGLALDISGFELADGRILSFGAGDDPVAEAVLSTIRAAGCGWFTTILGPGSDAAHANHLHLDIQKHGASNHYRICE